jgi:hypothetical protein
MKAQNDNQALLDSILAKAKAKDPSGQKELVQLAPKARVFATAARKLGANVCAGSA